MHGPIEYELDPITLERTGRVRRSQWLRSTLRRQAVPPSERSDAPFAEDKKEPPIQSPGSAEVTTV